MSAMMQGLSHALLDDFGGGGGGFLPATASAGPQPPVFQPSPYPVFHQQQYQQQQQQQQQYMHQDGGFDDHQEEFNLVLEQSVQQGKLNDQLLIMPAAQGMDGLSFDGLLELFQADENLLDMELPPEWMATEPSPVPITSAPQAPEPIGFSPCSQAMSGQGSQCVETSVTGAGVVSSCEDCQTSGVQLLTAEISSAQRSFYQRQQQAPADGSNGVSQMQTQGQPGVGGAAMGAVPPDARDSSARAAPSERPSVPGEAHRHSSTGGVATQMSAMFRDMENVKQMNRSIDAQLEEKLGIKVPKTNEITEFCDKHGRQALEDTLWELEKEHNFLSKGVQEEVSSALTPKGGFLARAASALGVGFGRLTKGKSNGKGRVRPKDHLEALEQQAAALERKKKELEDYVHQRSAVVERMDTLLNMKTEIMEEVKMENVSIDSQLQESLLLKFGTSLDGLSMEERAKSTSLPALFLGDAHGSTAMVESLMETWKASVQRLTELMNESSQLTGQGKLEVDARIDMQVKNVYNHLISTCAPSAGTVFVSFVTHCWEEAERMNPSFLENKFEAINKAIKFDTSQLKKLLSLNKIFTSKMIELVARKVKVFHEMTSEIQNTGLDFTGRCRELQKIDKRINELRLINISILESRLLFNFTMFRKVFTHWQLGMCIISCYPMLPEPQFLSCAVLGVKDLRNVPASTWKEVFLAED